MSDSKPPPANAPRESRPPLASAVRYRTAADRVAVVVNGRAKQVTEELVETLDQIVQSGDLFVSRSLDEGKDIARIIVERGYPTVLTGGGDGTFVQMVSWVVRSAEELGKPFPRFGLLKLGTGNALAWVLAKQPAIAGPAPGTRPKKFDIVRAADWVVALVTGGLESGPTGKPTKKEKPS